MTRRPPSSPLFPSPPLSRSLVVSPGAGATLRRRQAEENDPAEAEPVRPLRVLDQLVHRRLGDARKQADVAPHAAAVTHKQRPHELRGNEVRFLHQAAQRGGATQPAHPANWERAHRASNLDAPCAASKPATATPAAAGSAPSMSADAVIWTDPARAVSLPNNRAPSPESRFPTYAATGA